MLKSPTFRVSSLSEAKKSHFFNLLCFSFNKRKHDQIHKPIHQLIHYSFWVRQIFSYLIKIQTYLEFSSPVPYYSLSKASSHVLSHNILIKKQNKKYPFKIKTKCIGTENLWFNLGNWERIDLQLSFKECFRAFWGSSMTP